MPKLMHIGAVVLLCLPRFELREENYSVEQPAFSENIVVM